MRLEQELSEQSLNEAYRILRTKLLYGSETSGFKTILITSALREEGKTSIAKNLALALAQAEKSVLLLDGDLRNSNLTKSCIFPEKMGLSDLLSIQDVELKKGLLPLMKHLDFITAGSPTPNPVERLTSNRLKSFLEEVRSIYDFVIIDSPALTGIADAQIWAALVDGVVLVVSPEIASLDNVRSAQHLLAQVNAHLIGAVLNQIKNVENYYPIQAKVEGN